jgi:DNA segregation ATPase FtsK/SpoIIIE-like protein
MPQLFSRMDNASWLTPSIAEILEQGATPPGGDGSIRQYMLQLQTELSELGTPARIVNYRLTPSYTLFIARPDTVGRLTNRRTVTPTEIRRSIGKIAEQHKDWTLGFLPQLQEGQDSMGILLRTDQHQPLSLRRLLVLGTYRDNPSTLAFTLGITLEQQLIVRDLASTGHLLVVGSETAKQHVIRGLLLTFMLLNTPGEVRLAIAGQSAEAYKAMVELPHALGRLLVMPADGLRLFEGLFKEVQRRLQWFKDAEVQTVAAYNAKLKEQGKPEIPHILLTIDSLSDPNWQASKEQWAQPLSDLILHGKNVGIFVILTAAKNDTSEIPRQVFYAVQYSLVMRSAAGDLSEKVKNFHGSLMRFIDGFFIDKEDEENIVPVELCAVSDEEVQRATAYWKQMSVQRKQEAQLTTVSGKTGVTGILRPTEETTAAEPPPTPPVPAKPDPETLARATQALGGSQHETVIVRAQALAAYLGWLGVGPLHDILGISTGEAQMIVNNLQELGVLEATDSPTPRFIRLINSPLQHE